MNWQLARRPAILLAALLVVATVASGCGNGYSSQAMIYVANLSHSAVAFHSQEPSGRLERLLPWPEFSGYAFDTSVQPCSPGGVGLPIREQQITIKSDAATYSFVLHDPDSPAPTNLWGDASIWIVIHPDGTITRTTEANAPPSPYCGA